MMVSIGFTGTRFGMTDAQRAAVWALMRELIGDATSDFEAHHGCCVGADAQFDAICRRLYPGEAEIVVHPGPDGDLAHRAQGIVGDQTREPLPHMQRNRAIVDAATVMIATPYESQERRRGGTWSTVRMARRAKKPLAIVHPNGSVEKERWPS